MIPVPGLDSVVCSWVTIQAEGFDLHGFFVYSSSDHRIPEYINGDGLADLDQWSTNECAVFIVHSPSTQWIEYAKSTSHTWWKLFGDSISVESEIPHLFLGIENEPLIEIGGTRKSLKELFSPCLDRFIAGDEISRILRGFSLRETQHPCLILFKDLRDHLIWYIDMSDLVGLPIIELRKELQIWFDRGEFRRILEEARNGR